MNHSDWFSSIDSSWINQAKIKRIHYLFLKGTLSQKRMK